VAEDPLVDRLDRVVDAILARRDATAALADPELARLAVLAAELKHCPSLDFRARLRANLERRTRMSSALATTNTREGFTTITPYLRVREAGLVDFLARVFGAEETQNTPGPGGGAHREVRVGDSMIMIGEGGPQGVMPFRPAAFHVYVKDVDAAFQRALAAGAESMGAPEDRPYGERAGFVRDLFGNHWYIATRLGASHIPEGVRTVTPALHPRDGGPGLIEFLKRAFGAEEEMRHESSPGVVLHARLRIGNAAIELGETQGAEPMPAAFYLYVGDADALYEQAVAAGAKPLSPPADQPYGDRVARVEDPMGNVWFIARPA
jgi:PhnB protein